MVVITGTGLAKWLAKQFGIEISDNQVRFAAGIVATITVVVAGLLGGSVPGVGPMPTSGEPGAWLTWVFSGAAPLVLFATAVWRYAYRPEPELELIAGETVVTTT